MSFEIVIPDFLKDFDPPLLTSQKDDSCDLALLYDLPPALEEKALLTDLLSCLVGGQGSYIRRRADLKYELKCQARDSAASFIKNILPLCDNYFALLTYSQSHYEFKYGRVVHALCAALRTVLCDYTQQIANIEMQPRLTFALLNAYLLKPSHILQSVASFIQEADKLHGTSITSRLYDILSSNRGDPDLRKVYSYLFSEATKPVLSFIYRWIYLGIIDDPEHEFFIAPIRNETTENYLDSRFEIVKTQIPKYLPNFVTNQIFITGVDQSILVQCHQKLKIPPNPVTLEDLQRGAFSSDATSNVLTQVLITDHKLYTVLKAIHQVFLCQRGNILNDFFEIGGPLMRKPRDQLDASTLTPLVHRLYPKEFWPYLAADIAPTQYLNDVKLFNTEGMILVSKTDRDRRQESRRVTADRSLWDYFVLRPVIPPPIDIIVTGTQQEKLSTVFRHFLMWSRLQHKIVKLWRPAKLIRSLSVVRHEMQHFVTNYIDFLSSSVFYPAWIELKHSMEQAKHISELVKAHEAFVDSVCTGCFFNAYKVMELMSYIASMISAFLIELQKWMTSTENPETSEEAKTQLAAAPLKMGDQFRAKRKTLVSLLESASSNDAISIYSDLIDRLVGGSRLYY